MSDNEKSNPYMIESERIDFEAWATDNNADITRLNASRAFFGMDYQDALTEAAWRAWKRRARVTL